MEDLLLPFMVLGVNIAWALFFAWVLWLGLRRRSERHQAAIELRKRALDKFSSSADFVAFLNTPGGSRFLDPAENRSRIHGRILFGMTVGIVLLLVGIALSILSETVVRELLIPGLLCGAIGLGLLISSFLAYRFHRSWSAERPMELEGAHRSTEAA